MERVSPRHVSISFVENYGPDKSAYAVLNVYDAKAKDKVLAKFAAVGNGIFAGGTHTTCSGQTIDLPAGRENSGGVDL